MGADQIGFVFKGPATLHTSRANRLQATRHAQQVLQAIRLWKTGDPIPSSLKHLGEDDLDMAPYYLQVLSEPADVVRNLLSWWKEGARDTFRRTDPDDPKQIIGFAGEMSWGDEPDGVGYRTLRDAYWLDIPRFFGIR